MIKIKQVVIVEGKYDKIRLENILDAEIITTGGFDIYNDVPKRKLLKKLADTRGIIVLTDSDRAGNRIRGHLSSFLPKENTVNLYIPQIEGREKRKKTASKDGYLGVEGIDDANLERLFLPFASDEKPKSAELTKTDLYELGLMGRADSSLRRDEICKKLDLPLKMSSNALLGALNIIFTKKEIEEVLKND